MSNIKILWADDEIDLLKPQLFFLEKKGYEVLTVTNGHDALDMLDEMNDIDVVFLDESMPGITGLETLEKIKENSASLPVVMITKNEAENIMEEAIGSQIDDYLIKPVNPNQILMTLKKIVDNKRLVSEKTAMSYQQEFRNISLDIGGQLDRDSWVDLYKKIISWELRLDQSDNAELFGILNTQKQEANREFSRFIKKRYEGWLQNPDQAPVMSHQLFRKFIAPKVGKGKPTVFLLLDNLRYDQWRILESTILSLFKVEQEDHFYSILPTSTQYSRNAIFAGMLPQQIKKKYPDKWLHDHEKGGKNMHEEFFLGEQIKRTFREPVKYQYQKITNVAHAKSLNENIMNVMNYDLSVIVYNFIDMLSHARTEMEVLKELAKDEKAYRSLTKSWFLNSPLWEALQKIAEKDVYLLIGTDHGTIKVGTPTKVIGDRETTTNLRYKSGRNLNYKDSEVFAITDPESLGLPKVNISSSYIFALEDRFFLYPNNYNYYNKLYLDTFQHGGISLEEVVCPMITLSSK